MVQAGLFEDEHVELLYGVIVSTSPHGPEHAAPLDRLVNLLVPVLAGRGKVRVQSAFAASDGSEPEPDLAVVPPAEYDDAHPSEAWLIVEVAKTSLAKDRGAKARLYAESEVAEYWVVNLIEEIIEVHTEPRRGRYRKLTRYERGDTIVTLRFPDVEIPVSSVLRAPKS